MGVEEIVFVATLDHRTSEVCQHADGKRIKLADAVAGENIPPLHPNCRSTIRAYIGDDFEPDKRRASAPLAIGGNNLEKDPTVIDNMLYGEWDKERIKQGQLMFAERKKAYANAKKASKILTQKGKPMDFKRADGGKCNPEYKNDTANGAYHNNCQMAVSIYALRRLGYDAEAMGFDELVEIMAKLQYEPNLAWLDPATYLAPKDIALSDVRWTNTKQGNANILYKHINSKLREGDYCAFSYKGVSSGHILIVERIKGGLMLYDPQRSLIYLGSSSVEDYFSRYVAMGSNVSYVPRYFKLNGLLPNPDIIDVICKKARKA